MTLKNYFIYTIICALSYCPAYAQKLYRQTNLQPSFSIFQEALKIDLSKSPDIWELNFNTYLSKQASNGWYPVKGELYLVDETEIIGYIYHTIGKNGMLDKQILVCHDPTKLYDSTVSVMNRTSYTKGKNLIDTAYNYWKNSDGSFTLDFRKTLCYHYFDYFERDSFYYEYIFQKWNNIDKQWDNQIREKLGYHDTLVQFQNRASRHLSGLENTWELNEYAYDSISYNYQGIVDTLYMIRYIDGGNQLLYKIGFTNDEQGRYIQMNFFSKQGNKWVEGDIISNITWTEWNGFMYGREIAIGKEILTPYKRTKISSYYINTPTQKYYYQKWWDTNNTISNHDTLYYVLEGKKFPCDAFNNIYNEYGDFVEWRNTGFSYPDENGKHTIYNYSTQYFKYTYDEIYGLKEKKTYIINLKNNKIDTVFLSGFKYTEFAPVSITEPPQSFEPTLRLVPNPVSGMVTISTTAEMQQLNIFDITGRLVGSQSPAGNQVVFDTGVLPKGVYLVQALLKDGGQRTGKMVVR
jgi:hypothetical protein